MGVLRESRFFENPGRGGVVRLHARQKARRTVEYLSQPSKHFGRIAAPPGLFGEEVTDVNIWGLSVEAGEDQQSQDRPVVSSQDQRHL